MRNIIIWHLMCRWIGFSSGEFEARRITMNLVALVHGVAQNAIVTAFRHFLSSSGLLVALRWMLWSSCYHSSNIVVIQRTSRRNNLSMTLFLNNKEKDLVYRRQWVYQQDLSTNMRECFIQSHSKLKHVFLLMVINKSFHSTPITRRQWTIIINFIQQSF